MDSDRPKARASAPKREHASPFSREGALQAWGVARGAPPTFIAPPPFHVTCRATPSLLPHLLRLSLSVRHALHTSTHTFITSLPSTFRGLTPPPRGNRNWIFSVDRPIGEGKRTHHGTPTSFRVKRTRLHISTRQTRQGATPRQTRQGAPPPDQAGGAPPPDQAGGGHQTRRGATPARLGKGATPARPGRGHPRRARQLPCQTSPLGDTPPDQAGSHPRQTRQGCHPRQTGQGPPPPGQAAPPARPVHWSGGLVYWCAGLPAGSAGLRAPVCGTHWSRRVFSSPTLARRSGVPAKLDVVWRSRILSRRSSGEVPLLWEGGDIFVLRMKTPVRDPVCVKLHKGPLGRRRFVHVCEIAHMPRTRAQASVKLHKAPGDIKFVYVY
ncbi:hypothetical protein Taro_003115, partial [Colocasia esculenta]|nr:hypothetical protein [Colocasia esculenta]